MSDDLYPLRPFRIDDRNALEKLIHAYPLATLISGDATPDNISLVPLLIGQSTDNTTKLLGHVDRNNPQAERLVSGRPVSFVFQGPNSYASPDLYPDPHLPGWLYVTVKGRGTITRQLDPAQCQELLCEATRRFGEENQAFSLQADDPRFDLFLHGIVAFEIEIHSLDGIAKLAQDKGPAHAKLAIQYLSTAANRDRRELLEDMRVASTRHRQ